MSLAHTWIISGATSIIAQNFCHLLAQEGCALLLTGRIEEELSVIAKDIRFRYRVDCQYKVCDLDAAPEQLAEWIASFKNKDIGLFLAHASMQENRAITGKQIASLVRTNITSTLLAIEAYCHKRPQQRQIVFISSAAASVGRCKNSIYGASKAAIDLYLQGLQQDAYKDDRILYARAGFIDTKQTYKLQPPLPKGDPKLFAKAVFKALQRNKKTIFFPWFWRPIMVMFQWMPWPLYRRLKKL